MSLENYQRRVSELWRAEADLEVDDCLACHGTCIESVLHLAREGRLPTNLGELSRVGRFYFYKRSDAFEVDPKDSAIYADLDAKLFGILDHFGDRFGEVTYHTLQIVDNWISEVDGRNTFKLYSESGEKLTERDSMSIFKRRVSSESVLTENMERLLQESEISVHELIEFCVEIVNTRKGVRIWMKLAELEEVYGIHPADAGDDGWYFNAPDGLHIDHIVAIEALGKYEWDVLEAI